MNPLAQLMRARGHTVQGSDRAFDQGQNQAVAQLLQSQGIELLPQDGSAIHAQLDLMVYSTAVEDATPEMQQARRLGLEMQTRPQLLASLVNEATPGIAIAGTSGKSSIVGMLTWIMRSLDQSLTVLGGAALAEDRASHMGCFLAADADRPLLAEACESDGTLIGYKPAIGLIHNITRDHEELESLRQQFAQFAGQSHLLLYNANCPEAAALAATHPQALGYGSPEPGNGLAMDVVRPGPLRAQANLRCSDQDYFIDLPQPGQHTMENACAAMAVAWQLGMDLDAAAAALRDFPGIARRYQVLGKTADSIRVIDDYAHNADKIRAVVTAAQLSSDRLIGVFQPHGFGPARFLRPELKQLLPQLLRPQDLFCYAPIFYAGGTVAKDISSQDLANDLISSGQVHAVADRQELLSWLAEQAMPNDTVLIMGARDPSLPELAQAVFDLL